MNLNHLRYALVLEQHRHFLNAARALGISQPALSRAIQSLEKSLGLTLFDRDASGVKPTESGAQLLESAGHLLTEFEDFERESELLRDLESRVLRLSLGYFPAVLSGHRALGELLAEVPQLRCRVRTDRWDRMVEVLLAREADLALAELSSAFLDDERFVAEPVSSNRGIFCCRPDHPLLDAGSLSLDALLDYPWVSTRLPRRAAEILGSDPRRAGRVDEITQQFVPSVETDVVDQMASLVARSDAIGICLLSMIERELDQGTLRPLGVHPKWLHLNYGFVRLRRRTLSPTAVRYMELVRRIEGEIAEKEIALRQRFDCPIDLEPVEGPPYAVEPRSSA